MQFERKLWKNSKTQSANFKMIAMEYRQAEVIKRMNKLWGWIK